LWLAITTPELGLGFELVAARRGRDRHRSQDGGSNKVGVEGAEEDNDMLANFVVIMEVEMTDGGQESGVAEDQEGDSTAWKDMTPHH
jgi:hypothetical protein